MRSTAPAVAVLAAAAVLLTACVNQGLDEEPTSAVEPVQAGSEASVDDSDDGASSADSTTEAGSATTDESGSAPVPPLDDVVGLASIEAVDCTFDQPIPLARQPACYEVSVPENWLEPDPSDLVILPVAVFEAVGSDDGADRDQATIFLDGGPGASTLDLLWSTFPLIHQPQLGDRDYIAYDQRGVGRSQPRLDCPELVEVQIEVLGGTFEDDRSELGATVAALATCRDRLVDDGADLRAYNSLASANDLEAIRALLGYERFNLIGVSYGTRLAQTFLRQYPDSVRSVVLDSIVPNEADLWSNVPAEAVGAYRQLFDGCAADPTCAVTYPDLEARFFALLDQLDLFPIEVTLADPLGGTSVDAVLDGDDVLGMVFQALYNRSWFSVVPAMVDEIEAGDYSTVEALGSLQLANLPFSADGMQISVTCNEEIPFESEDTLGATAPTEPGYDRLSSLNGPGSIFDLCRTWPAGRAPAVENETVTSDVPALLLAGSYDPITRPGNVDIVAPGLSNHWSFVFPNEGHGLVATPCGAELVAAFIAEPTRAPADGCLADSPPPAWVTGGSQEPVTLVEFEVAEPFRVRGVRPAAWIDAGAGVFARQQTALDPTSLIVQPTGGVVPDFLVQLLSEQLDVVFTPAPSVVAGGREWQVFTADADADQSVRMAASTGADGALVVLVAAPEEIDGLAEQILVPALEAVGVG